MDVFFLTPNFVFVLPDADNMKSGAINPTVSHLFAEIPQLKQIVCLKSVYQTQYPDPEGLRKGVPDDQLPRKTHKTSHLDSATQEWLTSQVGSPAHFMAATGGLGAACLVHAEMNGLSGYQVTVITDSHYVSSESMQAFEPILVKLSLPTTAEIYRMASFKDTLRESNQRGNAIFS